MTKEKKKSMDAETNAELVAEVRADFEARQKARRGQELQWLLNRNFAEGRQYCGISPRGELEFSEREYRWEQRQVFNHILPIMETRLSKLARVRPVLTVRPMTDDADDAATAKLSTKVLQGALAETAMPDIINEATRWSEICGTAFYKILWRQDGGGACVKAVSPFELYPQAENVPELQAQKSIIHAKAYSVEDIEELWGVKVAGERLNVYTLAGANGSGGADSVTLENAAVVTERYQASCSAYPDGRLTIVAGDTLIYDGVLPYCNGENGARVFPFVKQNALSMPGRFWGSSVIERLIPLQRAYNTVKNRKYEFLNRVTTGVLAVEDGSVDVDNLEQEGLAPGKLVIYRQGANPPRPMSDFSVPLDFNREEDRLLNEFILISGVSELMRSSGLYTQNVSGVALQLIAEQDDTRILTTVDAIRSAVKDAAGQILKLFQQFATDRRKMRVAGAEGAEMIEFAASDISAADIAFDTETELSETPAQRKTMVLELYRNGLLADENGKLSNTMRRKILDTLGFAALMNDIEEV